MTETADRPETVVEYTIAALREAIRESRLAPGQRLVVAEVTRMLGVSNGPVREAIRRLTGEGLVEITPHRGASVRAFDSRDVREIFQVREVLEGLAARLAAERIGVGDYRARLAALQAQVGQVLAHGRGYVGHNQAFHELVYEMAGNERVREQSRQLTLPLYRLRYHYLIDTRYARASAGEHQVIAEAILDGDPIRAERAMRNHIRNSAETMLEALAQHAVEERASRPPSRSRKSAESVPPQASGP